MDSRGGENPQNEIKDGESGGGGKEEAVVETKSNIATPVTVASPEKEKTEEVKKGKKKPGKLQKNTTASSGSTTNGIAAGVASGTTSTEKLATSSSKRDLAGSEGGRKTAQATATGRKAKGTAKATKPNSSAVGGGISNRSAAASRKAGKREEADKENGQAQNGGSERNGPGAGLGMGLGSNMESLAPIIQEQEATPVTQSKEQLLEMRLGELVERFRKVLNLKSWDKSTPFTEQQLEQLKDFFSASGRKRLFATLLASGPDPTKPTLCLQTHVPTKYTDQVFYFICKNSYTDEEDPLTADTFYKKVQFGILSDVPLQSLLRVMNGVYVPMLMQNNSWPDNVRKEFMGKLHKFMASLTDATYQMSGSTVLYVPRENISNLELAVKSKDLIQRLEILVVHWQRQIKDVINSQHASSTTENSGPLEEVKFWQRRCDDLWSISKQLNRPEVLRILEFLKLAKSSYMDQFLHLSNQIHEGSLQAQDNLKFLSALVDPCKKLALAEPKQIPPILPMLLSCVRLIWSRSKFYNTKERMTSLLRKISSEIIQRCRAKISLDDIFHGDVEVSMVSLQDSIHCGEAWKGIYKKMANHIAKYTKTSWEFDQSSIFAQIDAFVQRCRDLLEVCEGQIQFARKVHGGEKTPIPVFGGSRGPEIEKSVQDIEVAFEKQMEMLWDIRQHILDVKATRWHDDYNMFKQGVKDLEIMMQNVIASAFESSGTLHSSVELLGIFHTLAKREAIRRTVEKKTADVYQLFLHQINQVKIDFEVHRKTPSIIRWHPDYAGGAYWARSLLRRMKVSMAVLQNATFLPRTALADEAHTQYEPLVAALEDYISKTHAEWVATIHETITSRLDIPLMERRGDFLEMKFDKDLLRLFGEIQYWQKLKYDIPFQVQEIYSKKEELRVLREHVLLVVRDYNRIIDTLSVTERAIFKERIRFLDRKINAGLTTLTWASKGITDYFVKECRRHSHDVQKTVTQFIESNVAVQKCCKTISETLLWHVEYKKVYDMEEFAKEQIHHRNNVSERLKLLHTELQTILNSTHDIFKNDGKEVQGQWVLYIEKVDQLVEDALRLTVKRSLQEIAKSINGEGKTQDTPSEVHPLFKINVILQSQRVEFSPTLTQLEATVNEISREMISAIDVVPRLADMLPDAPSRRAPGFFDIISSEEDILKIFLSIQNGMTSNWNKCQEYLRNWDAYREIWEINKDAFIRRYAKLKPAMTTFDADINRYNEVANNTQKEETLNNIHFVRLDCSPLKHALVTHCNEWQNKLTTLLNNNAKTDLNNLHKLFVTNTEKLGTPPSNLDELAESLDLLTQLQGELPNMNTYFGPIRDQYKILEKYEVPITEKEKMQLETLDAQWALFQQTVVEAEKTLQDHKASFKSELLASVDEFNKNIHLLSEDFNNKGPFRSNLPSDKALEMLETYMKSLQHLSDTEKVLKKGLGVFKIEQTPAKDAERMYHQFDLLKQVWELNQGWDTVWCRWKTQPFKQFESTEAEDVSQDYLKRVTKVGRECKDWEVWNHLQERIKQLRRIIPIFSDLKNPAIRDRHWHQLMEEVGKVFDPSSEDFTLEKVIDMGLDQYAESIGQLSGAATKELSIEQGIASIEKQWKEQALDIVPYKEDKGCYRIRSTDAIFELLEDNQVTLSAMKSSKYYSSFQKEIDHWEKMLGLVVEIIELLLQVQRSWVYLENIFVGTEDIRKQMPTESAVFDVVNTSFKNIMKSIYQTRLVLAVVQKPNLAEILTGMIEKLEKIQKSLDMYLETKRQSFPRFYFLSNEDLLEILGQAKDPNAVQPHLKKCFDNIHKLELIVTGTDNRRHNASSGMHSGDGEFVPFTTPIIVEGPVEGWLLDVEGAMHMTLRRLLMGCLSSLKKTKRDRWLKEWPGQLSIVASQITWTAECTKALGEQEKGEKHALRSLKKKQISTLKKLADMVKTSLSKVERKKLIALITIEVHSRDVIDKMAKSNCNSPTAFEWLSQLRFYWDKENEDCIVKQTNTVHQYGHEYLGNSGRLVITPLTDRCYMTLTTALHLNRGGSPQGPAGTGKTETVKDLGKGLGKYVIVLNCSEALDYKSMGRMFSGLAQTGAWGCFDEFNRIDIEVLSVVALQVSSILSAISRQAKSFVFESTEIRLILTCGIFITMNPGYAGRTELPDNLKSLFRPVAMMVPDSALIAEIMLFAEGFSNTRVLAKKADTLYKLAIQQLSKQDHYDFGLRALTTALKTAGNYKRKDPESLDDGIIFLAMREMNLPKLTADDAPLFMGILSDLFTGVEVPPNENTELKTTLLEEMKNQGLSRVDSILTKAIQLYETKLTRHGVMMVGETGSGKSTTWKLLKAALTTLAKSNPEKYVPVKMYTLNPKALSLRELYGQYNLSTNEWSDGVLSNLMRMACSDEKKDQKWILFDGPVDTLWVESMNTVLDDSKVLTLINGERIALPEQVSLLFEVGDLSVASPATVSRCGMIYMDPKDLGWRPFVESWLDKREDKHPNDILKRLIEKYVPQTLDFRRTCEQLVPVSEIGAVRALCKLFDAVATLDNGVKSEEEETYPRMIELWFLFSLIWSLGGSLVDESRKKFDMFLREIEGQFPSKDTVYEYVVDKQKKTWVSWEEKLPSGWRYPQNVPFYKILVPTVDSLRYEFLFQVLLKNKVSVLLVGDVGIGKTILMESVLQGLKETNTIMTINMSALTSSERVQTILESKLEKRTKNVFVPMGGKPLVCFVDDFNMPSKDDFGSQPALELIKHWMDYGFWFDRQKQTLKYANDILMLATMGPPGGGRNVINPRVQSRFQVINMTFPSESTISRIYGTIINQKLQDFDEDVKPLGDIMTLATADMYHLVMTHFLPTPVKMHYVFNLRDISKVFQGLLRAQREYYDSRESMAKLWVHEMYRVFSDRLVTATDRDHFSQLLDEKLNVQFQTSLQSLFPSDNKKSVVPIFGDFMTEWTENSVYEEMDDNDKLKQFLEEKLEDYNLEPGHIQLDLVLFKDAMDHIGRIIRVLRQPGGHMFLIGVGGSGRQSLARLATFVIGMKVFSIKITKHYRISDFHEELKVLFKMTGMNGIPTVFLLTDSQIPHEEMLEDLSSILTSGDVPNLFVADEFAEVKQALLPLALAEKIPDTTEALYAFFIERVRTYLHCVLCMSPAGASFRNHLRMFPALINTTTIDWFAEWPEDALLEVAIKYLEGVDLSTDALRKSIANVFVTIHTSVIKYAARMESELKRSYHITPTNYLELVIGYRDLLKQKRKDIGEAANKLKNGLSKLDDTKRNVEKISGELEIVKKQVTQYQKQCEDYLVIIVQQKREADEQAKAVAAKSEKLATEEEEVRAVADAAQTDLDQALPALDAATKALEALNKKDLQEVKSYGKPPPLVEKVMEAVMVLKKCEPTWDEAKRQLGNPNFIKQLIHYDKDNMSDKILKKISQYCTDENFHPEIVGRVSLASKSLCMWVRAMESYGHTYRQVAPKKEKLKVAQDQLEKKQKTLKEAKGKLQEIQDKLAQLEKQYDEKVSLKEKLRSDSEETELKLSRAQELVQGLSGERERWETNIQVFENSLYFLPGDCLFAAAFSSYAGPFNSSYRVRVVQEAWLPSMKTLEIPFNPDVSFVQLMGKTTDIREWSIQGLPSDPFSIENGIMVTRGRRWPLMIDPQGQAKAWIKRMEAKRDLKIIDLKQTDYLRTLEAAIQFGIPVLLQDISEEIDPSLDPVLNKSVIKKQGMYLMRLGDKEIEYHQDFKFYMTTKMANPHYAPEVFAKSTIVNFAVKEKGLEDQLLAIVVKREKPELEEQKSTLVVNVAQARKKLLQLEDDILHLLTTAQGSLLDDEKLVTALQSSKTTAEQVASQLKISEQTEAQIDVAREGYRPCAQRASILYFVLNDLAMIDPMYQFSLDAYIELFEKSISKSKRYDDLNDRILSLNDFHTFAVYRNTCRGLFEKHKLLFSLQMTVKILESGGKLNKDEYDFLLRGGQVLDKDNQPSNPYAEWLREDEWDNITVLDQLPAFKSLTSSLEQSERDWKNWYMTPEPEDMSLPGEWNSKVTEFQKMLIIRAFRPDRMMFCAQRFIATNLGPRFIEPPILDVVEVLADSAPHTPLIFVLSPGVDPTGMIQTVAKKIGMDDKLAHLSLGQGQSPKAIRLIEEGVLNGHWVFLANCHLSISWMPSLDKIVESLSQTKTHPNFRLWLSSSPHPKFPISILQNGIKMTTEPPSGIKANMSRLYGKASDATFPRSKKPDVYKKLYFALCFFHSVLLERRKFLTLGWNIPYDFNDSDFEVCENLVAIFMDEYEDVAWDALKYLIAEVNYGGRVTDEWDRRILRSYINMLFCEDAVKVPMYLLSSMATYYIPDGGDLASHREYIRSLPNFDRPDVFGQHSNADIASQIRESSSMLSSLLCLQPHISSGLGATREEKVLAIAIDIAKRVPEDIEVEPILKLLQEDRSPLNVVLLQEVQRYNQLLSTLRQSLSQLENSIKGIVVMSSELEEMFNCIFEGKVPPRWSKAYMSIKPLGSWTRDLILRMEHFNEWSKGNEPRTFWLGAFTFPTSFLTAVLQKNARRNNVPIDVLSWEFTVLQTDDESSIQAPPKEGVYIRGISLEGASWDRKNSCLKEPRSMELVTLLPPVYFKPVEVKKKPNKGVYTCPLYYFPIRTGTRERPSFVLAMELKAGNFDSDFWVKRGTAAFLSTI